MSQGELADGDVRAYYRAALVGLSYVEAQKPSGRRFGPDADARWSAFKGDLTTADRIDLLIRDADAQWPSALGARTVFARRGVAEDEPFGAGWRGLDGTDAEEICRAMLKIDPPSTVRDALERVARAWEVSLSPFDVGAVEAAERLVIAGPSAIAAAVETFSDGQDLDWADQVVVVATPPAHRQLAAVAGLFLNATRPTRIVSSSGSIEDLKSRRTLCSDDVHPEDAL